MWYCRSQTPLWTNCSSACSESFNGFSYNIFKKRLIGKVFIKSDAQIFYLLV